MYKELHKFYSINVEESFLTTENKETNSSFSLL